MSDKLGPFDAIPFTDDADEVQTWKGLALSAISDLRRYASDELPSRRLTSANGYEADAVRLEFGSSSTQYQRLNFGRLD